MSKKVFFKEGNRLFTPYEVKAMAIDTNKYTVKKVYRNISEITETRICGRYDMPEDEFVSYRNNRVGEISTKQLRNRKVAKQMTALGLLA